MSEINKQSGPIKCDQGRTKTSKYLLKHRLCLNITRGKRTSQLCFDFFQYLDFILEECGEFYC